MLQCPVSFKVDWNLGVTRTNILCGKREFSIYLDEFSFNVQTNSMVEAMSAHDLVIILEQNNLVYPFCLAASAVVWKWWPHKNTHNSLNIISDANCHGYTVERKWMHNQKNLCEIRILHSNDKWKVSWNDTQIHQPPVSDTVTFNLSYTNIKRRKEWAATTQCGKKRNIKCGKKLSEAKARAG